MAGLTLSIAVAYYLAFVACIIAALCRDAGNAIFRRMKLPLLYTFRRCPYAIRARLAISVSGVEVTEHEVSLRDKPADMLRLSPKGTVPVLLLPTGEVLEQSLDIMHWALALCDPEGWRDDPLDAADLVQTNDGAFKQALDRYKYPDRHPNQPQEKSREEGEVFLRELEARLTKTPFLGGEGISWVDAAIFPFIRQFVAVDPAWFANAPYPKLRGWLDQWLASERFEAVMQRPTSRADALGVR
jgi:glutathione S-transferase